MSESKSTKENVEVVDPTGAIGVADLPSDAVALFIWRKFSGSQPFIIVVTLASWLMNKQVVVDAGFSFDPERIYEFESPSSPEGRKTVFHLQDVIGWAASVDTGTVPEENS